MTKAGKNNEKRKMPAAGDKTEKLAGGGDAKKKIEERDYSFEACRKSEFDENAFSPFYTRPRKVKTTVKVDAEDLHGANFELNVYRHDDAIDFAAKSWEWRNDSNKNQPILPRSTDRKLLPTNCSVTFHDSIRAYYRVIAELEDKYILMACHTNLHGFHRGDLCFVEVTDRTITKQYGFSVIGKLFLGDIVSVTRLSKIDKTPLNPPPKALKMTQESKLIWEVAEMRVLVRKFKENVVFAFMKTGLAIVKGFNEAMKVVFNETDSINFNSLYTGDAFVPAKLRCKFIGGCDTREQRIELMKRSSEFVSCPSALGTIHKYQSSKKLTKQFKIGVDAFKIDHKFDPEDVTELCAQMGQSAVLTIFNGRSDSRRFLMQNCEKSDNVIRFSIPNPLKYPTEGLWNCNNRIQIQGFEREFDGTIETVLPNEKDRLLQICARVSEESMREMNFRHGTYVVHQREARRAMFLKDGFLKDEHSSKNGSRIIRTLYGGPSLRKEVLDHSQEVKDREEVCLRRCQDLQNGLTSLEFLRTAYEKIGNSTRQNIVKSKCSSPICVASHCKGKKLFDRNDFHKCPKCKGLFHKFCLNIVTSNEKHEISNGTVHRECNGCELGNVPTLSSQTQHLASVKTVLQTQLDEDEIEFYAANQERKELEAQLKQSNGPLRRKLEQALRDIGCDQRIWYQEMTGNQIRKLLRSANIQKIIDVFPDSKEVQMISKVLTELSFLMSNSDNANKSNALIDEIEKSVNRLVSLLRELHPQAGVTLKLHLLAAHLVPYIRKNRNWGRISEQGIESLHAVMNQLNRRYASVRNKELKYSTPKYVFPSVPPVSLNEYQNQYVQMITSKKYPMVLGSSPFGCGKSMTIVMAAITALKKSKGSQQILVSQSNYAGVNLIDIARKVKDTDLKILRYVSERNWKELPDQCKTEFDKPVWMETTLRRLAYGEIPHGKDFPMRNVDLVMAYFYNNPRKFHIDLLCDLFRNRYLKNIDEIRDIPVKKREHELFAICMKYNEPNVIVVTADTLQSVSRHSKQFANVTTIQIDEACQLPECTLISLLVQFPNANYGLIGDIKQLPPYCEDDLKGKLKEYGIGNTMERAIQQGMFPEAILRYVYRCHPKTTDLLSELFYDGKLISGVQEEQRNEFMRKRPDIWPNPKYPLICVDNKDKGYKVGTSCANKTEKLLVKQIVRSLMEKKNGYKLHESDIGVISFYAAQTAILVDSFRGTQVKCGTVDAFQGSEREVIVLCCTNEKISEFMQLSNRLNVAMSRARQATIVIGNLKGLSAAKYWRTILESAEENGCVVDTSKPPFRVVVEKNNNGKGRQDKPDPDPEADSENVPGADGDNKNQRKNRRRRNRGGRGKKGEGAENPGPSSQEPSETKENRPEIAPAGDKNPKDDQNPQRKRRRGGRKKAGKNAVEKPAELAAPTNEKKRNRGGMLSDWISFPDLNDKMKNLNVTQKKQKNDSNHATKSIE